MDVWPPNIPETLENLCLNYFVENIFKFLDEDEVDVFNYRFKPGISFPQGLSDKLLNRLITNTKHPYDPDLNLLSLFEDRGCTALTELGLRYTSVTCDQLAFLCAHPIRNLDISYCKAITSESYVDAINHTCNTLRTLRIGGNAQFERLLHILTENGNRLNELPKFLDRGDNPSINSHKEVFKLPNLCSLVLRDIKFRTSEELYLSQQVPFFLQHVIQPLRKLTHLDLSECQFVHETLEEIGNLDLPLLVSLSLSDVINGHVAALDNLCNGKLKKLRHLDISQGDETRVFLPVQYPTPSERLRNLVLSLPNLSSLDISGTNLAGFALIQPLSHKLLPRNDVEGAQEDGIKGLEGKTLEFLGLLDCSDDPSHRQNVPAKRITGDANEEQVLTSVQVYQDKPNLLTKAFNNLFNLFRVASVRSQCTALEGILSGMQKNLHNKHVQISGSASLFYLVKGDQKHRITQKQRRRVINCLLDSMEMYLTEQTMMRNGCLTLCHFNIPFEVMYCYNRLVKILLSMLQNEFADEFLQRIGIFLLNSLACQVEGNQKQALGDLGTISVMCDIIKRKYDLGVCDEILEVAWSTLWNVTDETASNCKSFMDEDGMNLFLLCFAKFPDKEELLRNMMGLMGNIAEVTDLRPSLMIPEYVTVFSDFLESTKDGIEVSYNASGVLAHMLSDGVQAWKVPEPTREEVICRMTLAIKRWPLDSKRNINYRSFLPILRLVGCYQSYASQYWATWALCNLTQVYPEKYCDLLEEEGGLELLEQLSTDPRPINEIRLLAQQILNFIKHRKATGCDNNNQMNGGVDVHEDDDDNNLDG